MTDKELLQQVKKLQQVKASDQLHQRVHESVDNLPSKYSGFYFPLFAFRTAFVVAVLLLCVLATSGVVIAAAHSSQNAPLYPVKVLIQKVVPSFIQQKEVQGAVAPTPTPLPTVVPTEAVGTQNAKEEKNDRYEIFHNQQQISPTIGRNNNQEEFPQKIHDLEKQVDHHDENDTSNNGSKEKNVIEELLQTR